ncbi:hypothetical protein [Marixanthomonas ophiurae]|nr:hypothetical protein [Marixanthomonas ophiurae]
MNKSLLFFLVCLVISTMAYSQDCPEPTEEKYINVLGFSFTDEYVECPVIIEAEYLKVGYLKKYNKPRKFKKKFYFQCLPIGGKLKPAPITNEMSGDIFVIDKEMAHMVVGLEKGDKIKVTGTKFIHTYFGKELSTFFNVQHVEKVE